MTVDVIKRLKPGRRRRKRKRGEAGEAGAEGMPVEIIKFEAGKQIFPPIIFTASPKNPGISRAIGAIAGTTKVTTSPEISWNPGHYVFPKRGAYFNSSWSPPTLPYFDQNARFGYYDEVASLSEWQGFIYWGYWGSAEPTKNDIANFVTVIEEEIAYLQSLSDPKQLWLYFLLQRTNGTDYTTNPTSDSRKTFPQHAADSGDLWFNGNRTILRWWDADSRTNYKEFLALLGAALDSNPGFEGITLMQETSNQTITDPAYSTANYLAGIQDIGLTAKANFPRSNVCLNVNGGMSDAQAVTLLTWCKSNAVAMGSPDCAPQLNSGNGFTFPASYSNNQTSGDEAMRAASGAGVIPTIGFVEGSTMGIDSVGIPGGYSPEVCYDWFNVELEKSHMFWIRNDGPTGDQSADGLPSPEQHWDTGIKPFVAANPTLSNLNFPSSYGAVQNDLGLMWDGDAGFDNLTTGLLSDQWHSWSKFPGVPSEWGDPEIKGFWNGGGQHRPEIVTSPTFTGSGKSFKTNTITGSTNLTRSQFTSAGYMRNLNGYAWNNTTHWIGWAMYVDPSWPSSEDAFDTGGNPLNARATIWDNHNLVSEPGSSPVYGMHIRSGTGNVEWRREIVAEQNNSYNLGVNVSELKGVWSVWVAQVKISKDTNGGFYRLWKDDALIFDLENVTTYEPGTTNFGYYKFGIYTPWTQNTLGDYQTRTMWFDQIRVAEEESGADYNTVRPR